MSAPQGTLHEPAAPAREAAPAALHPTHPFRWSLRRELWENRSAYLAPAGVGAFAVVALVIHAITMPSHMPGMLANDPGAPGSASVTYRVAALLMLATAFVTGAFYCLEALNAERRDRSILFWKSLPVSDRVTVLAKVSIPLLVLPAVTFVVTVAMHLTLVLLSAVALLLNGAGVGPLWRELRLPELWPVLLYCTVAMTLWHAPVHAFLLLVSGWARRTAALWAVLPLLAIGVLEKLTMDTAHFAGMVQYRLLGFYTESFGPSPDAVRRAIPFHADTSFTPGRFLSAPALWLGLVVAAVLLAGAMRMRRYREPV
jgi:ABC-2 type transport system permease protein